MGIIHSRASKKRDRAQADLLKDELQQRKRERRIGAVGDSVLLQPTLGGMIGAWRRRRQRPEQG